MKQKASANPDFLLLGFDLDVRPGGSFDITIHHSGVRGFVRSLALESDRLAAMVVDLHVGRRIFGHHGYPARLFSAKRPESARMLPRVAFDTSDHLSIQVRVLGARGGWLHGALCVDRIPLTPESPSPEPWPPGWEVKVGGEARERYARELAELKEKAHKLGVHIEER